MKERRITHVALVITLYHSIYMHLLCISSKDYRPNHPCYFVAADTHHFSLRGRGAKQQRPSSFVVFRRDDDFNLKSRSPPSSTAHASSAAGGREPLTGGSDADPDTRSLSGVRYGSVLSGIDALYPPSGWQLRNAASRTDGYWPYITKGDEPPRDLVYGEFDLYFFARLLDRAHYHFVGSADDAPPATWEGKVFVDLGSGTGRLTLGAAALHPSWKLCRGIELLKGLHEMGETNLAKCDDVAGSGNFCLNLGKEDGVEVGPLPMSDVKLSCGSFDDVDEYFGDTDCAFAFSTAFTPELMGRLGAAVCRQCQPGSIVITTDYMLPLENYVDGIPDPGSYRLELAEKVDGWNWLTGGESTAFIHRVVTSAAGK